MLQLILLTGLLLQPGTAPRAELETARQRLQLLAVSTADQTAVFRIDQGQTSLLRLNEVLLERFRLDRIDPNWLVLEVVTTVADDERLQLWFDLSKGAAEAGSQWVTTSPGQEPSLPQPAVIELAPEQNR